MIKTIIIAVISLMPLVAYADAVNISGIYYNLNYIEKTAEVTTNPNQYKGLIEIPSSFTYGGMVYTVTSIGDHAFYNNSNVTSVTLPNTITKLEGSAFYGCVGLTNMIIPNSVTEMGDLAFYNCRGLTSITISNNLTKFGANTFGVCLNLTSVNIPTSVTSIGESTFHNCRSLASIIIPDNVTTIERNAFGACHSLTSITIPNSVTSIGNSAFSSCIGLTSITIPNSVTSIGSDAFAHCTALSSITLPETISNIEDWTFWECTSLNKIVIPNSVTGIGHYAFSSCTSLSSITIPKSVTQIGGNAFGNCMGLTDFYCEAETLASWMGRDGLYVYTNAFEETNLDNIILHVPASSIDLYRSNLPWSKFKDIVALDNSTPDIPETITNPVEIDGIYYNLDPTKEEAEVTKNPNKYYGSVVIPTSVTYRNTKYSVTAIEKKAFENCDKLSSIVIPNSVTTINESSFYKCSSLTSVKIPNSVTSIEGGAFSGCSSLTSITIPNSVTNIGITAFSYCTGLTSIIIPNSVKSIDNFIFWNCNNLTSVTLSSSMTSIVWGMFKSCSRLKTITIPNSVTSIEGYAFSGCTSLNSIDIPTSVKTIDKRAFENCTGLTSITIPKSVNSLSGFYGCTGLTSITIPNSVTDIEFEAFYGCSGLISVDISNNIKSIKGSAFANCKNLTDVICRAEDVPSTNIDSFNESYPENITLHVPGGTIDAYKAKEPWSKFKDIVAIGTYFNVSLTATSGGKISYQDDDIIETTKTYKVFENQGMQISFIPDEGYSLDKFTVNEVNMGSVLTYSVDKLTEDLIVVASFKANKYKLIYQVNGKEYKTYELEYGSSISQEAYPSMEGYTFSGWSNIPATMPAHDVTVTGTFTKDALPQCATPTINFSDDELSFSCATQGVEFVSVVTVSDAKKYYDAIIKLAQTYKISVYATKNGYERSDIATKEIVITNDNIESAEILTGDVNGDGVVNVADHVKLSDIIMKSKGSLNGKK